VLIILCVPTKGWPLIALSHFLPFAFLPRRRRPAQRIVWFVKFARLLDDPSTLAQQSVASICQISRPKA